MNELIRFLTEHIVALIVGLFGAGAGVGLLKWLTPSQEQKIRNKNEIIKYLNKRLNKIDRKVKKLEKERKEDKKRITDLEVKYELTNLEVKLLKKAFSDKPENLKIISKIENQIKDKEELFERITGLRANSSLTRHNINMNVLFICITLVILAGCFIFFIYNVRISSDLEIQKEMLELQLQNNNN